MILDDLSSTSILRILSRTFLLQQRSSPPPVLRTSELLPFSFRPACRRRLIRPPHHPIPRRRACPPPVPRPPHHPIPRRRCPSRTSSSSRGPWRRPIPWRGFLHRA